MQEQQWCWTLRGLSVERLWGYNIELPVPGSQTGGYAINVAGWVLGRSSLAVAVELVNDDAVLLRVPLDILRPGIVVASPEVPGAERSGFQITLDLSEMAPAFDLLVQTVFEDGSRVRIGVIRGRRRALYSDSQPRLQPLMPYHLGSYGFHLDDAITGRASANGCVPTFSV
jgi:hypothetical protein